MLSLTRSRVSTSLLNQSRSFTSIISSSSPLQQPSSPSSSCSSFSKRSLSILSISNKKRTATSSSTSSSPSTRPFSSKSKRDFYDILSLPKTADKKQIKAAYFKLAKQYHPDTNKDAGAETKFKEASEAYEMLSDDNNRAAYDRFGHAGVENGGGGGGGGGGNPFGGGGGGFRWSNQGGGQEINIEDLFGQFGDIFGQQQQAYNGPRKGQDLQARLNVNFMEAVVTGVEKDIDIKYQIREPNGKIKTESRTVTVNVPPGVEDGMNLRVSGQGSEGSKGGPPGDMYVQVSVDDHPYFERAASGDIHVEVGVSISVATLGGAVDVKTVYGDVEMKIPKGSQPGNKLLMRGKGAVNIRSGGGRPAGKKGDQIVHLKVLIPTVLSDRQVELMREFEDEGNKGLSSSGDWEKTGSAKEKRKREAAGIGGRLAQAVNSFFGNGKKGEKEKGGKGEESGGSGSGGKSEKTA